jgi:hypothetical protein
MDNVKTQALIKVLQKELDYSEKLWKEGQSHPFIIGYLQGVIKTTIIELEN